MSEHHGGVVGDNRHDTENIQISSTPSSAAVASLSGDPSIAFVRAAQVSMYSATLSIVGGICLGTGVFIGTRDISQAAHWGSKAFDALLGSGSGAFEGAGIGLAPTFMFKLAVKAADGVGSIVSAPFRVYRVAKEFITNKSSEKKPESRWSRFRSGLGEISSAEIGVLPQVLIPTVAILQGAYFATHQDPAIQELKEIGSGIKYYTGEFGTMVENDVTDLFNWGVNGVESLFKRDKSVGLDRSQEPVEFHLAEGPSMPASLRNARVTLESIAASHAPTVG